MENPIKDQITEAANPLLTALLLLLSGPQLLSHYSFRFMATIHRVTKPLLFRLPVDLYPLILLTIILLALISPKTRKALLPFLTIPFLIIGLGWKPTIPIFAVILSIFNILHQKNHILVTKWILRLSTLFYAQTLLHWAIFKPFNLPGVFAELASIETGLFYIILLVNPLLILLFFNLWPIDLFKNKVSRNLSLISSKRLGQAFLVAALVLSSLVTLYPYLPSINPENKLIGVDTHRYIKGIEEINNDFTTIITAAGGSRPVFFLFMYLIQQIFGLTSPQVVKYLPMLISPLLIFTQYLLVKELGYNNYIAGLSSFFTACGMKITVGLYSYFLTNIFGLSLVNLSLLYLSKSTQKRRYLFLSILFAFLLNYTHPWTFLQLNGIILLTTTYIIIKNWPGRPSQLKILIPYLVASFLTELTKSVFYSGVSSEQAATTALGKVIWLSNFWKNSFFSLHLLYGGFLSNTIITLLAIIGLYFLKKNDFHGILLKFYVYTSTFLYVIGDDTIKGRLLYNTPMGIYAAIGYSVIAEKTDLKKDLLPFLILFLLTTLLRSLANLV